MRFKFILGIILIFFSFSTFGHEVEMEDKNIEEIVKLRMKNMSSINSLSKKIYIDLNSKNFENLNTNTIELMHNTMDFKNLFPEGSMGGKARKAIWEDKKLFNQYIEMFIKDIDLMIDSIKKEDSVLLNDSFNKMTSNCGKCHKKFKDK